MRLSDTPTSRGQFHGQLTSEGQFPLLYHVVYNLQSKLEVCNVNERRYPTKMPCSTYACPSVNTLHQNNTCFLLITYSPNTAINSRLISVGFPP